MQTLFCIFQIVPGGNAVLYFCVFLRYHLGDYGGEILNEVKLNRPEKEMSTTPSTLHNGNHHKVQECKVKVSFLLPKVSC